ncbi:zinc-binding dehydrogenase [Nocardia sp. NBC_01503]|uniref:zinc-binding dehydrogenase n=1 Tax=Nocardia sp. NBC_01503 TaxID=2975997 RepID=UPI002E7B5BA7|nr:zinc-binding dehydrogenase [Nocardia sp. NBC_01503]WTL32103.1 zinc-binding dehydrogenase [Nocardia sp. NBC_01503]
MKAITISHYGAPEVLTVRELPDPVAGAGEILLAVKAFGLNHAETYMRSGQWGEVAQVTGIEAAGVVAEDPSGRLAAGTPVVAIMGGMGRTRNGSYAELVTVPAGNVVPVDTTLEWTDLAAIPEVYATAWTALHDNLAIESGHTVLVRGATSALGQAAVNVAADLGAKVIATTRSAENTAFLENIGATEVLLDDGQLATQIRERAITVDSLLDLVGNSVLRDSVATVRTRGRVCQAGFLGGLNPVTDFAPIADLPSGVQLSFFGSFNFGTPEYPLSAVPIAALVAKATAGTYHAKPVRTFAFEEIVRAHEIMESGTAGGKMTVAVG